MHENELNELLQDLEGLSFLRTEKPLAVNGSFLPLDDGLLLEMVPEVDHLLSLFPPREVYELFLRVVGRWRE